MANKDEVYHVPLSDILYDDTFNCRGAITPQSVHDLSRSIQDNGLQCPILLRTAESAGITTHAYQIVAGHRRFKAFEIFLKQNTIPAFIRDDLNEETAKVLNLVENLDREDVPHVEQAMAMQIAFKGKTHDEIAAILNRSANWVRRRLVLLKLPPRVQGYVTDGYLTQSDVEVLMQVPVDKRGAEADKMVRLKKAGKPASVSTRRSTVRNMGDVRYMINQMLRQGGEGIGTYALAWAISELTTEEFTDLFQEYLKEVKNNEGLFPIKRSSRPK
jgi:ParB family chromosome partitioning protein